MADTEQQWRQATDTSGLHYEPNETSVGNFIIGDDLYDVTTHKIIKNRSLFATSGPDAFGRSLEIVIDKSIGALNPIVARTLLTLRSTLGRLISEHSDEYAAVQALTWSMLEGLAQIDETRSRTEAGYKAVMEQVQQEFPAYIARPARKALPQVAGLESDFPNVLLIGRRLVSVITEVVRLLAELPVEPGQFNQLNDLATQRFGSHNPISSIALAYGDKVNQIVKMRIAVEHREENKRLIVHNVFLEEKEIWFPTWKLQHPQLVIEERQDILSFIEDTIVILTDLFEDMLAASLKISGGRFTALQFRVEHGEFLGGRLPHRYRVALKVGNDWVGGM